MNRMDGGSYDHIWGAGGGGGGGGGGGRGGCGEWGRQRDKSSYKIQRKMVIKKKINS